MLLASSEVAAEVGAAGYKKRVGTKRVVVVDCPAFFVDGGGRRRRVVFRACFTESVDGGVLDWFRCQLTIGEGNRVTLLFELL